MLDTVLCVQEDCLSSAQHCYSLARLVALQLSVLQSGRQVINLDNKKVVRLMEELPFQEVCVHGCVCVCRGVCMCVCVCGGVGV